MSKRSIIAQTEPHLVPTSSSRRLTGEQFRSLAAVPPEAEWFANLDNPRTRSAYRIDMREFMASHARRNSVPSPARM